MNRWFSGRVVKPFGTSAKADVPKKYMEGELSAIYLSDYAGGLSKEKLRAYCESYPKAVKDSGKND